MAMTIEQMLGLTAYDLRGARVGPIVTLHSCAASGEIAWATVVRGIAGAKQALVPLAGAQVAADGVHLRVHKSIIKKAPQIEIDGALSEAELARLGHHYGLIADQTPTPRKVRRRRDTAYAKLGAARHRPTPRPGQRRSRQDEPRPVTVRHHVHVVSRPRDAEGGLAGKLRSLLKRALGVVTRR
jgi:hypothetical protein